MKNEEKAKEIANGYTFPNTQYDAAMQMARWKYKQFAEEKQALIDKVCTWLKENMSFYISIEYKDWEKSELLIEKEELTAELKKAMEESL